MRMTGRHRFIRLSVFFLVYSVIHVVSVRSNEKDGKDTPKDISEHPLPNSPPKQLPLPNPLKGTIAHEPQEETKEVPDHVTEKNDKKAPDHASAEGTKKAPSQGSDSEGKKKPEEEKKKPPAPNKEEEIKKAPAHGNDEGSEKVDENKKNEENKNTEENKKTEETKKESDSETGEENKKAPVHEPGKENQQNISYPKQEGNETIKNKTEDCVPAAIRQFPRPLMPQRIRSHGGLILHIIVAIYMFVGLALVCDEYFVASLDRICEEMKMAPDVAGATFMAAGSSAPELATVIIGVFYAEDDIGISGVIGSAVFNIMFVISVCALATETVVYLNWWPLIRDSTFYALSIFIMLLVLLGPEVNWIESTIMLIAYVVYCVALHYNPALERWSHTLPVPFKTFPPNEQSGLVSYKKLAEDRKHTNYGIDQNSVEQQPQQQQQQDFNQWSPGNEWSPEKTSGQTFHQEPISGPALNQATTDIPPPPAPVTGPIQQDYYKPKEYDPSTKVNPLVKPADDAGSWAKFKWAVLFPIHFFCIYTMPDCRSEKYKNWYPFTFFISMLWISFYSYFMVWMITIIGYTLGIPDTVMGLTFVAAGVSVPDALSSIAVIKEGYGDMAVSNAIGSNVFDILVCLGLPWFLKTAVIQPGSYVTVKSRGLTYSTLSLLSTVAFLIAAVHFNGWKLDRKLGIILMIWYLLFITFASLYELNVFGYMNPVDCKTDY